MPALPPVPSVIAILLLWDDGSDANAMTRIHVQYSGAAPTDADMTTYAGQLEAGGAALFPDVLDTASAFLGAKVIDLTSPTAGAGESLASTAGVRSGDVLGAGVAALVNFSIARRYRGGKPKAFLPWGTATDLLTRQTWKAASITDFLSAYSTWFTDYASGDPPGSTTIVGPVSVSYYGPPNRTVTGSTGRVRTLSTTRVTPLVDPITGIAFSTTVASQRRRNLR